MTSSDMEEAGTGGSVGWSSGQQCCIGIHEGTPRR
jgi:hypothetical protein